MGFRFRRSVRFGPVRLNVSKSGFSSVSIGGRGATINLSQRGVRGTVGIPGTGLSYSEMLARPSRGRSDRSRSAPSETEVRDWLDTRIGLREELNEIIAGVMAVQPDTPEDTERIEARKATMVAEARQQRAENEAVIAQCEAFLRGEDPLALRPALPLATRPAAPRGFLQLEAETLAAAEALGIPAPRKPRFTLWILVFLLGLPLYLPSIAVALYSWPRRLSYRASIEDLARQVEAAR